MLLAKAWTCKASILTVCINQSRNTYIYVCMYVHVCMYVCTCVYVCMYVCMCVCIMQICPLPCRTPQKKPVNVEQKKIPKSTFESARSNLEPSQKWKSLELTDEKISSTPQSPPKTGWDVTHVFNLWCVWNMNFCVTSPVGMGVYNGNCWELQR